MIADKSRVSVECMRRGCIALLLGFGLFSLANPTHAAEDRCLILGPLAVSSYIGFLEQVAQGKRDETAQQSRNAADVITLYEQLGCPQEALVTAIECLSSHVVTPSEQKPIAAIAQQCMENAGMPTR